MWRTPRGARPHRELTRKRPAEGAGRAVKCGEEGACPARSGGFAQEGAAELMALARGEEVLFLGEEQNGYLKVTGPHGDGWVRKILVNKR